MPMDEEPIVGTMYEDEDGKPFEVLAFDEDDGTIEVQYADETVGEIDIDAWYEMDFRPLKSVEPWKEPDEAVVGAPSIPDVDEDDEKDDDLEEYDENEE